MGPIIHLYNAIKQNNKIFFLILILIFASFYIYSHILLYSYKDISLTIGGAAEEALFEYVPGQNFALKGFNRLIWLPDYSTDFKKDSQPIFYTHNPPLPSIIQGLIIKIGLNIFQSRIIYILISLVGIGFLYLFIANIASITAAIFSSILLIINFSGFLSLAANNHYALGFPLLFGYLWAHSIQSPKKYLIVPVIFLIASLTSYAFLPFIIILEFLFFIFQKDRKLFFSSIGAAIGGIMIHIVQNIIALTPAIAWQDIWLTISNRLYGIPNRQELLNFYQNHNLVLWGADKLLIQNSMGAYIHSVLIPFRLFKTSLFIAIISAFILCAKHQGNFYKNRQILIPAFSAFFIWHASIVQTIGAYPPIFHIFLAIFLGIILSDLLYVFIKDYRFDKLPVKNIAIKIAILLAIIMIVFKYLAWTGKFKNDDGLINLLKTTEEYQGKTFFTNLSMPHIISFKTGNWVVGSCLPDGLLNLDTSRCYSKFTALKGEYLIPDYILLSSRSFAFNCQNDCFLKLKKDLAEKYQLIEEANKGENIIFKVKND